MLVFVLLRDEEAESDSEMRRINSTVFLFGPNYSAQHLFENACMHASAHQYTHMRVSLHCMTSARVYACTCKCIMHTSARMQTCMHPLWAVRSLHDIDPVHATRYGDAIIRTCMHASILHHACVHSVYPSRAVGSA
jgi:hypothetical protein